MASLLGCPSLREGRSPFSIFAHIAGNWTLVQWRRPLPRRPEDRPPVARHADDRPSPLLGLVQRLVMARYSALMGEVIEDPSNANSRAEAAPCTTPTWFRTVCLWFGRGMGSPVSRHQSTPSPRSHRESTTPRARDSVGDARAAWPALRSNLALGRYARQTPCHKTTERASFSSAKALRSEWSRR